MPATVILTKRTRFCAAHRLNCPSLTPEENLRLYDKCNNENGHGHNYQLIVKIRGEIDPVTGMVINLNELKKIIKERIIVKLDHKHLNHDVDFLEGINPTAENVVVAIWEQLNPAIGDNLLYELELIETENNAVFYRG